MFFLGMDKKEKIIIFHVYRRGGKSLILHPFTKAAKLCTMLDKYDVEGKYGEEPRVETLTLFRNDLYRLIEEGVKDWVSETRFIPRFLISSLVFLVAYFLFSFAIRDPIPVIDEIIIAIAAFVVTFILIGKRDMRSDLALKRRIALRTSVDRIVFSPSTFVKEIEIALQTNETEKQEQVLAYMDKIQPLPEDQKLEAIQLVAYLEERFKSKEWKKTEKIISNLSDEKERSIALDIIKRMAESKNTDLSLFALYAKMKKTVEQVKT